MSISPAAKQALLPSKSSDLNNNKSANPKGKALVVDQGWYYMNRNITKCEEECLWQKQKFLKG